MTVRPLDSFARPVLLVALAAGTWLAWLVRTELVVLFAAALFASGLYALAGWLADRTPLSREKSVLTLYLSGIALAVASTFLAGHRVAEQYDELASRLPASLERLEERLQGQPLVGDLVPDIEEIRRQISGDPAGAGGEGGSGGEGSAGSDGSSDGASGRGRLAKVTFRAVALFVVWGVLVFYLAYDGRKYVGAAVRLVPPGHRPAAEDLASSLGSALPWWIVGRLASMAVVTVLTAPALLLLGIPLAFLLAVMAGLFSFVPFVGPIAAFVPALLVTLESAPDKLLWVVAVYAVVQLLESNLITPKIQQYVASVPPLLLIGGQLLLSVVVGMAGVMFAAPLLLAVMVTVQVVYLRHGLGESVSTPHGD